MEVAGQPFGSAQQHARYLPSGIGGGSITRTPLDLSSFGGGSYVPSPRHGGGGGGGGGATGVQAPLDTLTASQLARGRRIGPQDRMGSGLSGSSGCLTVARLVDQFMESRIPVDGGVTAEQPEEEPRQLGNYCEGGGGIQAAAGGVAAGQPEEEESSGGYQAADGSVGGVAARQPEEESSGDYQAGGSVGGYLAADGSFGGFSQFIQPVSRFDPPEEDWLLRCLDGLANLDEDFMMPDLDLHVPAIATADAVTAFLGDDGSGGGDGGPPPPPPPRDNSSADILAEFIDPAPPREGGDLVEWMPAAGWAELVRIGDTVGGASSP